MHEQLGSVLPPLEGTLVLQTPFWLPPGPLTIGTNIQWDSIEATAVPMWNGIGLLWFALAWLILSRLSCCLEENQLYPLPPGYPSVALKIALRWNPRPGLAALPRCLAARLRCLLSRTSPRNSATYYSVSARCSWMHFQTHGRDRTLPPSGLH